MRYVVNANDIETVLQELGGKNSAAAIQTGVLEKYCGGVVPEQYKSERSFRMTVQRIIENHCPQAAGYDSLRYDDRFTRVSRGHYVSSRGIFGGALAEEISSAKAFPEGAVMSVTVNAYERNRSARLACIAHHGVACLVCGANFFEQYGVIGLGYIHVHHLLPLADIGEEYEVDPVKDLIPVCPNCHAMLHAGAHSVADLQHRMKLAAVEVCREVTSTSQSAPYPEL